MHESNYSKRRAALRCLVLSAIALAGLAGTAQAWSGSWTTPYVSEETYPATCADNTAMSTLRCSGSYCDNVQMTCLQDGREPLDHYWTSYKSEEQGYNQCSSGYFVTAIDCKGSYCDSKALQCTRLSGAAHRSCQWVGSFSEEAPVNYGTCPSGKLSAGIYCSGSYCDNLWNYCCTP